MFEAKAIELLQQPAITDLLYRELNEKTDHSALALPENYRLKSLEEFQCRRNAFRGHFQSNSISSFTLYTKAKSEVTEHDVECFVNTNTMTATAFFDIGSIEQPGHCQHSATLRLIETSPYKAIQRVNGKPLTQREASDFLEDWIPNLQAFDGNGEPVNMKKAIDAVRRITIDAIRKIETEVGDLSESASLMERIDASSKDTIPAVFVFSCEPYVDFTLRKFELRLGIRTSGDRPSIVLRIMQLEAEQELIAEELSFKLEEQFSGLRIKTFIGDFNPS